MILDILMPEMEGEEIAAKLSQFAQTKNIPVLYITALFPKADEEKYRSRTNGSMIFIKPLDVDKLLEQIKKLTNVTAC